MFEVTANGIKQLKTTAAQILTVDHSYSPIFPKVAPNAFEVEDYNNATAKYEVFTFAWKNGEFKIDSIQKSPTIPKSSSVQSVVMRSGPTLDSWSPRSQNGIIDQVLSWLNSSSLLYGESIPSSNNRIITQASIGPAELQITCKNHQMILIYPANYLIQTNAHTIQTRYVKDVIAYSIENQTVYLKSPELYAWLQDNQKWQSEFTLHG